jgi:hypothetical protein
MWHTWWPPRWPALPGVRFYICAGTLLSRRLTSEQGERSVYHFNRFQVISGLAIQPNMTVIKSKINIAYPFLTLGTPILPPRSTQTNKNVSAIHGLIKTSFARNPSIALPPLISWRAPYSPYLCTVFFLVPLQSYCSFPCRFMHTTNSQMRRFEAGAVSGWFLYIDNAFIGILLDPMYI